MTATLPERFDHGLGLALPGKVGQRLHKAIGLGTFDVQRHVISLKVEK